LYASKEGHRLMLLATHPCIAPGSVDWKRDTKISETLTRVCNNLEGIMSGGAAPPPIIYHQNAWGKFSFRAYQLENGDPSSKGPVGITVERMVPRKLKLVEAMRGVPLSPKQKEVCLALAEGQSHRSIATGLNVRTNTVIDHV